MKETGTLPGESGHAAAVPGPRQAQYAANRQMIGQHITADELEAVQDRVAKWKAAHPR